MDWNQSTMYEQRVRFILEVQQRTFSFAESCRRYSISRGARIKGCVKERRRTFPLRVHQRLPG